MFGLHDKDQEKMEVQKAAQDIKNFIKSQSNLNVI